MSEISDTEQRILESAKTIFYKRGLKGARMQDIADEASINRASLNYYFRSKDKLYRKVLMDTLKEIAPVITNRLHETLTLRQLIEVMVSMTIDTILENPKLIIFYVITLNDDPEAILDYFTELRTGRDTMTSLSIKIENAVERGEIRPLNPEQLVWNITSMCCYPFLMQPLIKTFSDKSDSEMITFYEQQKKEIVELVLNGIKKE